MASLPLPLPATPNPDSSPPRQPLKTLKNPNSQETRLPNHLKNPENAKTPKSLRSSYLRRITSLCKNGLVREAYELVAQMEHEELPVGPEVYGELLQGCVRARFVPEGLQIHAHILKRGSFFHNNEYIATKLLVFYAQCDCLDVAEDVFLRLPRKPNAFAWAAIIGLRSRLGLYVEALIGFCDMLRVGVPTDSFIVPNVLKACAALRWVGFGKGVHAHAWKRGLAECVYVLSSLVDFYGKCGALDDARDLFDEMPERTVVSWNTMLVGFIHNGLIDEAVDLFYDMRLEGVLPTRVSVGMLLSASANLEAVDGGRQGHAVAVSSGLELDCILGSSIINFYCKVGLVEAAEAIFRQMTNKDVVTWNLMVSGYMQDGQIDKALHTCHQMLEANLRFDCVTLASIITACVKSCNVDLGRAAHGFSVRNNLESDTAVACSLIDLYASCMRMEHARRVFDAASRRDVVLWNAMILGYTDHGTSGEALQLFYQMQLEGVPLNAACWNSAILGLVRNWQFEEAQDMLSQMLHMKIRPNLSTWSMLIGGLAENGLHHDAMSLYCKMHEVEPTPCPMVVTAVLLAIKTALAIHCGKAIHAHIVKIGLLSSISVVESLIDMYSMCNDRNTADTLLGLVQVQN